jgi:chemotaxis protein methyltransferase CheR
MIEPDDARALGGIRAWITRAIGLRFDADQSANLDARIDGACRRLQLSPARLLARLDSGDHAVATCVAEEVSTNHTYFFREPEMFAYVRTTVVPTLAQSGPLRVWSAACSSGEEAFSLAIALSSELGAAAARSRVRILGTDISERQIRRAERARYLPRQLTGLDGEQRAYFHPAGADEQTVRADVASMCVFRRLNLTSFPWPFQSRFHLIFLRNVLYYFDPPMRSRVLAACAEVVEPGGWLITSLTEPMVDQPPSWTAWEPGVYRRSTERAS